MKRKITFLLAALLLSCGLSWAQTDVLNHDVIGVSGTSYSSWTDLTLTSGAVYAGNTAGGNNAIQMRSNNNNSGIVITTSAGVVTNITVAWNSNTSAGRTLNVYGSNTAYSAASDLYGNNAGTLIGTIAKGTTDLAITDEYAFIGIRSASGALYLDEIQITWSDGSGVTPPSITASDVEIAYDIDGDEIEYFINNPVNGGVLTASTTSDWLTLGEIEGTTIPFTCTINQAAAARTATVILTYTYNTNQTVTKNVTVTQTGNPNAVDNISDITAAGIYTVQGTIVAKSTRGFIVGDGTGYVYYYNTNYTPADYNIGDMVKLAGSVVVYGGVFEFNASTTITAATSSNYVAEDPTVLTGADMDARVASTTPPQLSNYVQYEGTLTIDDTHYNITSITGASIAIGSISYPLNVNEITALNGKHVKVTGYYVGISSSTYYNTIIGSVEEVVSTEPSITITPATLNVDAQEHLVNYLDLAYENIDVEDGSSFTVHYYNAEGEEIQVVPGEVWMIAGVVKPNDVYQVLCVIVANEGEARTAYFKVSAVDAENNTVYSNLVTVNQEAYVAPTYAELPFAFNSGRAAIEETDGLSQEGLGTDYSTENTKLKFDGTGDWLLLQFDERPGTLTFDIKGNSFNGSTFTVQTSEDGETFTDLKSYTNDNFGNTVYSEEFTDLGENVRYIKWIYTEKVQSGGNVGLGNIALAEYEVPVIVPSITITPDNFELDANSHMGEVLAPITYQNIVIVSGSGTESFDVQYYDAEGQEIEQTWCSVGAAANGDTDFNLIIAAGVNEGNEARTAYFKLYGLDEEANLVYSNLITVTQAAPVIDYAVLPFVWEGGPKDDFLALNGVTAQGLGSDYASGNAPYLIKFDNTGDYIQVKCDQQPGKVTIGVKMIGGGNTSTITIQGSADGETFTDIEVLTISGAQNDELTLETTNVFADADRYVRMLFTKGSNVGVGPITIEKGSAPSIAVTPATIDLEATGTGQNGVQMQQFVVTYHNLDIESHSDFAVQFYDAEGEEQEQPAWITPNPAYIMGGNENGYMVMLFIEGNTDVARSAYFKVYALVEEDYVYSNLVTINQAGVAQQYTLTVEPFENLEIFTFVGGDESEMALEGAGTIQVAEGDNVMLSISALEGYEIASLMMDGEEHVQDIDESMVYLFDMPGHNVTISATAVEATGDEYVLYTGELVEGDYVICYHNNTRTAAMKSTVENGRLSYEEVIPNDNGVITTDDATIVWHIAPNNEGYWTIYSADANAYAAGTGVKNKAQLLEDGTDDKAMWSDSLTEDGTYEFVNKANAAANVNAYLRNNGTYGFACYATTTGGALSLYKKVEQTTVTQTIALVGGEYNRVSIYIEVEDPVEMLEALKAQLGDGTVIESANYSTENLGEGDWFGDLDEVGVNNEEMYFIVPMEDCTIELEGMAANPADHQIILLSDTWNRIGFPFTEAVSVIDALGDYEAEVGDVIEGPNGQVEYYGDGDWFGDFEEFVPGEGYMYYSAKTNDDTLVFSTGAKKARNAKPVIGTSKNIPAKVMSIGKSKSINGKQTKK